jgi:hypothetical protein
LLQALLKQKPVFFCDLTQTNVELCAIETMALELILPLEYGPFVLLSFIRITRPLSLVKVPPETCFCRLFSNASSNKLCAQKVESIFCDLLLTKHHVMDILR